ncbi:MULTISPECIES: tetratricopeptide repeat protein [unclassified Halomonas]|uniref:tetratricopeptide repeat protein n=1 Tax=unclassified Halomonas TaxID=2609666 RepID=UPI00209C7576|nr:MULTISPECIES: tetratricopeptide repeat protein [unclassified Halomonas]MCP1313326.1 sel1 repeat family protein [Halomonas sp. 707D7]MCP1325916.1 sel1 repeat family protein [Halomonas sp. 707D4]
MRITLLTALTSLLLVPLILPSAWALDDEAQGAKEEGMRLWGIHQWERMQPPLEIAAESGDAEAMYYLGEANRLLSRGLSQAALDWYYQAAQHGEPYAMLRLFDGGACELGHVCPENGDDWPQAALELTLPQAEAGDSEAMAALYYIYYYVEDPDEEEALTWLNRAAEAGNAWAMNMLGKRARDDEDAYSSDTERLEAAEVWFRRAAEAGYAPGMNNLASVLNHLDHPEKAWQWMTKASEAGHMNGRGWLAACNIAPNEGGRELCRGAPEPDPAEGWAIFLAIHEEVPGTSSENALRAYHDSLTPEQRAEGERMKDDWLGLEPPLSYFPEKFGP